MLGNGQHVLGNEPHVLGNGATCVRLWATHVLGNGPNLLGKGVLDRIIVEGLRYYKTNGFLRFE